MAASQNGFCLSLTGLPPGKTTLATELANRLRAEADPVKLLDGDGIRRGLNADFGFDRISREAHARRVSYVAKLLPRNRGIVLVALISPYRAARAGARNQIGRVVVIYVRTPLEVCERREVKGL